MRGKKKGGAADNTSQRLELTAEKAQRCCLCICSLEACLDAAAPRFVCSLSHAACADILVAGSAWHKHYAVDVSFGNLLMLPGLAVLVVEVQLELV